MRAWTSVFSLPAQCLSIGHRGQNNHFFTTYSIGWCISSYSPVVPIEKYIQFNSQNSQSVVWRISESELASDASLCHVTYWALPMPEHTFYTTANLWWLLPCQRAAPHLWFVGPTRVTSGQRKVRESKPLKVHVSFPDIYRCGILW